MKVKASIKQRCEYCYIVKRRNAIGKTKLFVYCKRNARHKQRQG